MITDIKVNELSWEPHPVFKDLLIKRLLSHEKDNVDLSIAMVKVKKGHKYRPMFTSKMTSFTTWRVRGRCGWTVQEILRWAQGVLCESRQG